MERKRKFRVMDSTFLLYRLVNKVNGNAYIGITSRSLHGRWLEHKSDAMCGKSDQPIHRAIRKYGPENFAMELLEAAESWEALCQREIDEIALHRRERTIYNATCGGEGTFGIDRTYTTGDNNWRRRTPEGRDHLRGEKNHMHRPEQKERMRNFNPAKVPGVMDCIKGDLNPAKRPEVRAKIKANNAFNDPARRDDVRAKLSASKKGKPAPWMAGDRNIRRQPEERARITGGGNPNAKGVIVHGVVYGTLMDAAKVLGFATGTPVKRRIEDGVPGFCWADQVPEQPQNKISYTEEKRGQLSFINSLVPSD